MARIKLLFIFDSGFLFFRKVPDILSRSGAVIIVISGYLNYRSKCGVKKEGKCLYNSNCSNWRKGRKKINNCIAFIFNLREGFSLYDDTLLEIFYQNFKGGSLNDLKVI